MDYQEPIPQRSESEKPKKVWSIVIGILSPPALSVLLGLLVRMLPRDEYWRHDICLPYLSQEVTSAIAQLNPALQEIVFPCSVLAVQASIVLPMTIVIIGTISNLGNLRYGAVSQLWRKLPIFAAIACLLWMDLFYIGFSFDFASRVRSTPSLATWLITMSFFALAAVVSASLVAMTLCKRAHGWIADRRH